MSQDLFNDLRTLLSSKTLPDKGKIDRILVAYNMGVITIDEAIADIAKWFDAQKSLFE